jgi:hypothetical protein
MKQRLLIILVLSLALGPSLGLLLSNLDLPGLGYFHEDGLYFVAAKSLSEGHGYRILSLPGEPYQTKHPPLFPLILSLAWTIAPEFPANLSIAAVLAWLPLPFLIGFTFRYFLDAGTPRAVAVALGAGLALNPWCAYFANTLLAEVWLTAWLLLALLLAQRISRQEDSWSWLAVLAGLVGGGAFLTRSAGLFLLISTPALFLLQRRARAAVLFAAGMLPAVAGWMLWSRANRPTSDEASTLYYLDYFAYYRQTVSIDDLPLLAMQNINGLLVAIGDLVMFDISGSWFGFQLARLIGFAALAGVLRTARTRGWSHYAAFGLAQAAVLTVWNFPPNTRFVFVLLPLVWHGLYTEVSHIASVVRLSWQRKESGQRASAAVAASLLALFAYGVGANGWQGWRQMHMAARAHRVDRTRASAQLFPWITQHLPAGSRFYADRDPMLYLHTGARGRSIVIPPAAVYKEDEGAILSQVRRIRPFLDRHQLDYVLVTPSDFERYPRQREKMRRAMLAELSQPGYEKLAAQGGYEVYKVRRDQTGSAQRPARADDHESIRSVAD